MIHQEHKGFSLIEVLLALGMLAGVLVATATLFVVSDKSVRGGRTASEALSIARSITEEIQGWGFHQTYRAFGLDGTLASYTVDTRSNGYARRWQTSLPEKLHQGYATIELASLGPGGTAPALVDTNAIRVLITVHWDEGPRHRSIELATVRM
jgi:prepilin-type N-terminal cleavage/methylation domain-containing protein